MVQNFSWAETLLSVGETAVGALLGFLLGLLTLYVQRAHENKKEKEREFDEMVDVIARIQRTAVLNLETLANLKLQIVSKLARDNANISVAIQAIHDSDQESIGHAISNLENRLLNAFHFLQHIAVPTLPDFPPFGEFTAASLEMPHLMMFVHRSQAQNRDLISAIEVRNTLVSQYASLDSTRTHYQKRMYFAQMLSSCATGIEHYVDYALAFNLMAADQTESFLNYRTGGDSIVIYKLAPKGVSALPKNDDFSELRSLIKDFKISTSSTPRKIRT